ncbi:MAG: 50S ribosomal protein L31 [Aquificota bacterium]|nr:MAG: 50S ribosomal protein L31 [Aquificota bacterium]
MKKDIHPELKLTHFVCGCGNEFDLLSTKGGVVHLEVCNQCHPFYTGKLKIKPLFLEIKGTEVAENQNA